MSAPEIPERLAPLLREPADAAVELIEELGGQVSAATVGEWVYGSPLRAMRRPSRSAYELPARRLLTELEEAGRVTSIRIGTFPPLWSPTYREPSS